MLKKIFAVLAALLTGFCVYVALQPSEFRIARSATMAASAATVFAQVNDLHRFDAWSPWAKLDPEMKHGFEGPAAGVGAISTWDGNQKVGSGRMTIIESSSPSLIRMKLEMFKPFPATSQVEFSFAENQNQTTVTWAMAGHSGFIPKMFCVFFNQDKMVGGDFEKGLAQLKALVEAPLQP